MAKPDTFATTAARMIYESYPDQDLLPIEPPKPGESIARFKRRAEYAGDTLFLFLCREADDQIEIEEYLRRLNRAQRDIEAVRAAFRDAASPGKPKDAVPFLPPETIRLPLDGDWIELTLDRTDAEGRRFGVVASNLHTPTRRPTRFDAAIDAIESLVLGHACAGIDVTHPRYLEGIRTCLDACAQHI